MSSVTIFDHGCYAFQSSCENDWLANVYFLVPQLTYNFCFNSCCLIARYMLQRVYLRILRKGENDVHAS